jgi:hypothetical protein
MAKKQDIMEINIELHEENRKLLKAIKSGADIAHLIKDMAQTMKRSLDLAEKEVSIFGETRDLFETSKDRTWDCRIIMHIGEVVRTFEKT